MALDVDEVEDFKTAFNKGYACLAMRQPMLLASTIHYFELAEKFKTDDKYNDDINKAWEQIDHFLKNAEFKDDNDEHLAYIEEI